MMHDLGCVHPGFVRAIRVDVGLGGEGWVLVFDQLGAHTPPVKMHGRATGYEGLIRM